MLFSLFDSCLETTPFVLNPNRAKVLGLFTEHDHNLCGFNGIVNVWLILFRDFISQTNTAKEHLVSLGNKGIIKILRINTILSTLNTVFAIAIFKTDKHIVSRFFAGLFEPFNTNLFDIFCLSFVAIGNISRSKRNCLQHILVVDKGILCNIVTSGNLLVFIHIGNIHNTRKGKRTAPICFVILRFFHDNIFKQLHCLFKVAVTKRRPRISAVDSMNVIPAIDFPFVSAIFADIIIAHTAYRTAASFTYYCHH